MNKSNSGQDKSSDNKSGNKGRGFASMDKDKQREISKKGGEASHGGKSNRGDKK